MRTAQRRFRTKTPMRHDCDFYGADLTQAVLRYSTFEEADFRVANLSDAELTFLQL